MAIRPPSAEDLEPAVAAFRSGLGVALRQDARLTADLAGDARPVIEALAFAIATAGDDPTALEYREGLAMGALLGRRAALYKLTPSATMALFDSLANALAAIGSAVPPRVLEALRAVIVEGFCAAIEERMRDDAARRAAEALAPTRIGPDCWAIVIAGEHEPDRLGEALDRAGRVLLDADARACLLHLAVTVDPSEELAAEIFGFDTTARWMGAQCVFSGVDAAWREVARPRIDLDRLAIEETLEAGLKRALAAAGAEIRVASPIVRRLRKLFGGSSPRPP